MLIHGFPTFRAYLEDWQRQNEEAISQARAYLDGLLSKDIDEASYYWRLLRCSKVFKADCDRVLESDTVPWDKTTHSDHTGFKWGLPLPAGPTLLHELDVPSMLALDLAFSCKERKQYPQRRAKWKSAPLIPYPLLKGGKWLNDPSGNSIEFALSERVPLPILESIRGEAAIPYRMKVNVQGGDTITFMLPPRVSAFTRPSKKVSEKYKSTDFVNMCFRMILRGYKNVLAFPKHQKGEAWTLGVKIFEMRASEQKQEVIISLLSIGKNKKPKTKGPEASNRAIESRHYRDTGKFLEQIEATAEQREELFP